MKKLLLILLCLPLLFTTCSKSDVTTPQTMEDVIVGKKWWHTTDKEGVLLSKEGEMYKIEVCQEDSLMGDWIIEEDLIKLRFYVNSIEYTALVAEVTSYTDTELKIKLETNDTNLQANYVLTTEFTEILGCTDTAAANYNQLANCDDGSCVPFIYGCTDSLALNYDSLANMDDGSCAFQGTHTYIPDDVFESELIAMGFDDMMNDYALTSTIESITSIGFGLCSSGGSGSVTDQAPIDFTGIEAFSNLRIFRCCSISGPYGNRVLDLSMNTQLENIMLRYGGITALNLKNGNNTMIDSLNFTISNNPNLTCIKVDNANWSTANWVAIDQVTGELNIDPQHYFSENCP
ncbi:hypothetical protein OAJ65_01570 [Flavobacteriales bacterium]|nr:hypothetical protein [Flavobacteriales bacterium]